MKVRIDDLFSNNWDTMIIIKTVLTSLKGDETWMDIKKGFDGWIDNVFLLDDRGYGLYVNGYIISLFSLYYAVFDDEVYDYVKSIRGFNLNLPCRKLSENDKKVLYFKELHKVIE